MDLKECRAPINKHIKRAGGFLLGQTLTNSTVKAITNYLAREDRSDNFRVVKVLTLQRKEDEDEDEESILLQGKIAIRTEHFLLKCLEGESGIVQQHGLFKDNVTISNEQVPRIFLVLDCYVPHDYSPAFVHLTNLYQYTRDSRRLTEKESIRLFFQALRIVQRIHQLNIIHQDLNMRNFILNTKTGEVSLSNFHRGRLLIHTNELISSNSMGSLLHQAPENIRGQPFLGKPSDMWAMGVVFYALLFSEYPFHSYDRNEVLRKIQSGVFNFPHHTAVSVKSMRIIEGLLVADPSMRFTSEKVLDELLLSSLSQDPPAQVVPHIVEFKDGDRNGSESVPRKYTLSWDQQGARVLNYGEVKELARQMSAKNAAQNTS